jgi:hypothetical protein
MKAETYKKLGDKRLMEEGIAANFGLGASASTNGGNFKIYRQQSNLKFIFEIIHH